MSGVGCCDVAVSGRLQGGEGTSGDAADVDVGAPPCFSLAALVPQLADHAELDLKTLTYHLEQSDATAADGYHHAAINEARSFLEGLVISILRVAREDGGANGGFDNGGHNGTAFKNYRRYLLDAGFIDPDENALLQFVYSLASAKGSHPGVTDAVWTRLARRMVFLTGQYVLQRYAARKSSSGRFTPPISNPQQPPPPQRSRHNGVRQWLGRMLHVAQ